MITPEDIPQPRNTSPEAEKATEGSYDDVLAGMQRESTRLGADALTAYVDQEFMADVLRRAGAGEIATTVKSPDGEVFQHVHTPEDMVMQFGEFLKLHDAAESARSPEGVEKSLKRIPRAGGLRAAVQQMLSNPQLVEPFKVAIIQRQADMQRVAEARAGGRMEASSGEHHETPGFYEKAAEDLGDEAAESAGVAEPDRPVDSAKVAGPDDDYAYLWAENAPDVDVSAAAVRVVGVDERPGLAHAEGETDEERYTRFIRETQQKLEGYYAEHRKLNPMSTDDETKLRIGTLENLIRVAKEDIGIYMSKLARLRGQ